MQHSGNAEVQPERIEARAGVSNMAPVFLPKFFNLLLFQKTYQKKIPLKKAANAALINNHKNLKTWQK